MPKLSPSNNTLLLSRKVVAVPIRHIVAVRPAQLRLFNCLTKFAGTTEILVTAEKCQTPFSYQRNDHASRCWQPVSLVNNLVAYYMLLTSSLAYASLQILEHKSMLPTICF